MPRQTHGPELDGRVTEAACWMQRFAQRALGAASSCQSPRDLWTDSIAIETCLGLTASTADSAHLECAFLLIDEGRAHAGALAEDGSSKRSAEGCTATGSGRSEAHPPTGRFELRPERWLRALDRATRATGNPAFSRLAIRLAGELLQRRSGSSVGSLEASWLPTHGPAAFGDCQRLLDGYVSLLQLEATARSLGELDLGRVPDLLDELCEVLPTRFSPTFEPLSAGLRLTTAYDLHQLELQGVRVNSGLINALLSSAERGLQVLAEEPRTAAQPAFRELGLVLGLRSVRALHLAAQALPELGLDGFALARLQRYGQLWEQLLEFWLAPGHQRSSRWDACHATNLAMLAAALHPRGSLELPPAPTPLDQRAGRGQL